MGALSARYHLGTSTFTEQLYFLLLKGILPLPPKNQKNETMKLEFGAESGNVMNARIKQTATRG